MARHKLTARNQYSRLSNDIGYDQYTRKNKKNYTFIEQKNFHQLLGHLDWKHNVGEVRFQPYFYLDRNQLPFKLWTTKIVNNGFVLWTARNQ